MEDSVRGEGCGHGSNGESAPRMMNRVAPRSRLRQPCMCKKYGKRVLEQEKRGMCLIT